MTSQVALLEPGQAIIGNRQTKLQASQIKQFITAIITHMPRLVCRYKTPKKVRVQVSACYQGHLRKNNPWKSGKPQPSYPQKNSFPRKNTLLTAKQALQLCMLRTLIPPDPSSPAGRVWETLEAWSRHEFLAGASQDDYGPLGQCSLIHNLTSSVVYSQHHSLT